MTEWTLVSYSDVDSDKKDPDERPSNGNIRKDLSRIGLNGVSNSCLAHPLKK